jgi:hypothetical protein
MPRPSHSPRFHHPNNSWSAVPIIQLLTVQFFSSFRLQTPSAASYSRRPSACVQRLMQWFSNCGWRSSAGSRATCRRLHTFTELGHRQVDPLEHLNTSQLASRFAICFLSFSRGTRGPQRYCRLCGHVEGNCTALTTFFNWHVCLFYKMFAFIH